MCSYDCTALYTAMCLRLAVSPSKCGRPSVARMALPMFSHVRRTRGKCFCFCTNSVCMILYLASVKFFKSVKTRCPPRKSRCMSCASNNILLSLMIIEKVHKVIEDENHCQKCGRKYMSSQKNWVGCDTCWRWWHFRCGGLSSMPCETEQWMCPVCSC